MKATEILTGAGHSVRFYPALREIAGGTIPAILLGQLLYWTGRDSIEGGWIYKNHRDIEETTGLSLHEQLEALTKLRKSNLLTEWWDRDAHKIYMKVNTDIVQIALYHSRDEEKE
jgi:hypothetical protein